ncbi:MAG TPA: histidine kinase, partial [Acidobacteriaceae bacterium]
LCFAPILQGLGTALTLAMVGTVREHDDQIRAAAESELRALQARLNPRFVSDALDSLAKLAVAESHKIPHAVGQLRCFLRASFDRHDQPLVRLEEELSMVSAYLAIESLRLPGRLEIVQDVDSWVLEALIPSFSLQGLVENALEHCRAIAVTVCSVHITISSKGKWLDMSVSDNGTGVPGTQVERVFFPKRPQDRLTLLRRQLRELFGKSFKLEICSELGVGTTATLRLPLQVSSAILPNERLPTPKF